MSPTPASLVLLCVLVAQSCPTLYNPMDPTRLFFPWNSQGKNTGVGCHSLLQLVLQGVLNWVYEKIKVPFGSCQVTSIVYVEFGGQKPS